MYILLNGAFGIGKTSVARELRRLLDGAAIFDPEHVGLVLQRLPWNRGRDFQDLASWRRLTVLGASGVGAMRRIVIIPMAFSDLAVLAEVRTGLRSSGRPVLHFCLTAPLEVVRDRLAQRGEPERDPRWSWVHRRAAECCAVHGGGAFAEHVDAQHRSPAVLAAEIARRIGTPSKMDPLSSR